MATEAGASKRRCVSTACVACRRRKSKCDGNLPSCAACSSVYHTPCIYDPNSDHRRKGVYKRDTDTLRTRHTTLQTLVQALLNCEEDDAFDLLRQIRSCDDLEEVAKSVIAGEKGLHPAASAAPTAETDRQSFEDDGAADQFEHELSGKMSQLVLDGTRRFIGGTSNLIFLPSDSEFDESTSTNDHAAVNESYTIRRWTLVTDDDSLISHLLTMYFTWHYPFFTLLAKDMFYRDYVRGVASPYCSSLLVNAMLALGCHFSSWNGALADPLNTNTAGDHFFKEAKRLILENDEHESAKLCTVQAFALMSVREAGCGREGKGWVYSGLSFRMALDLGLNLDPSNMGSHNLSEEEIDARRITYWGCHLIDKCWSNYLGRQPQLSASNTNVPKFEVFPKEETELWSPYTDAGVLQDHTQPSRTRAVAFHISKLCEISSDLLVFFYHPAEPEKIQQKQLELKRLSDIHTRLEAWKKELPKEMEPKEGQLPQVLVMHMFNQLLFIHLYRPFLKYSRTNTPLPSHVSPRRICTQAASAISKLLRMYKRTYGLRQICNIAVYIAHTACTIHLLNLPEKNAQRDIIHGLRNLEEMAEGWLCARRTLRILDLSALKWQVNLPSEATAILWRSHTKWGSWGSWEQSASPSASEGSQAVHPHLKSTVTTPSQYSPTPNTRPDFSTTTSEMTARINFNLLASSIELIGDTRHMEAPLQNSQPMPSASAQGSEFVPSESRNLRSSFNPHLASAGSSSMHRSSSSWFDPATLSAPQAVSQIPPAYPGTTSPAFRGPQLPVDESQEWWSHDSLGLGTWSGLWGTGTVHSPTNPQYQDDQTQPYPLPSATAQQSTASYPPAHHVRITAQRPATQKNPTGQNNSMGYEEPWQ
ncbi:Nitrogen assimilation transcription factor nirA [Penicillium diatomitis]|uniref:Nitrogen assimilation transcription factor nirA n=1 Tax=Penicillium diatomitis TaxID=2819901 RepID=A0A9W9XCU9_9EURO|nr:Nitrogen assimilation transcription factor nirA [Penicillium diatomitis]KAJ5488961.1 Nitrogen assimilation transcription factor nirA [Penicillium diatomitis]